MCKSQSWRCRIDTGPPWMRTGRGSLLDALQQQPLAYRAYLGYEHTVWGQECPLNPTHLLSLYVTSMLSKAETQSISRGEMVKICVNGHDSGTRVKRGHLPKQLRLTKKLWMQGYRLRVAEVFLLLFWFFGPFSVLFCLIVPVVVLLGSCLPFGRFLLQVFFC